MSYIILYACEQDDHNISEIVFPTKQEAQEHLDHLQINIEMHWWDIRKVVVM